MSGSEIDVTKGKGIPTRRVLIESPSQLPYDYSTTTDGTLFSTTPGGTRLIYDRKFLMKCRESPIAKSPPSNLAMIPGITCAGDVKTAKEKPKRDEVMPGKENTEDEPQFKMDI